MTPLEKNFNTDQTIIKQLFFQSATAGELSIYTKKSIPTVLQSLNKLLARGIVVEKGIGGSTGGRRPHLYALKEDEVYVVAVSMDQLVTRIALVTAAGKIVGEIEKYEITLANNPDSLEILTSKVQDFLNRNHSFQHKIVGIGIGMPGFIDAKRGINYSFLPSPQGNLLKHLEKHLSLPVVIENDSTLAALAELKWGAAQHKQEVMVINVGWGVGLGIILGGKLYRGKNGFAGEFSHIPLFDNNKICSCGKHGCLETETSMSVIVNKAIAQLEDGKPSTLGNLDTTAMEESFLSVIKAITRGDTLSIGLLSESAYHIGRGLAILIHLLNPETIVISGIGSLAGKAWIAPIQQALNEHCIPRIAENVEIKVSELGYKAELLGAAAWVMENYDKENIKSKKSATII